MIKNKIKCSHDTHSSNYALGIDMVDITRFKNWVNFSHKTLTRFFSLEEIVYCLEDNNLATQRFAVRFAAREATLKALSQAYPKKLFYFLQVARAITITRTPNNSLDLIINYEKLCINKTEKYTQARLSVSHTQQTAIACVILF